MPLDSRLLQRLLHLVELERLDDRLDLFHFGRELLVPRVGRADPPPPAARRVSAARAQ